MASPLAKPIVCPVLIGRAAYLDLLDRLIEQTAGGDGQTFLVAGEAGIGKSRLVAEARARAGERGWSIAQGTCFEADRALPYAPFLDLLSGLAADQPDAEIERRWRPVAPELTKLLPELGWRLPGMVPAPALEPEQERRRLFEAVARLIGGLAATRPALLVVEDLHWADDISLDLLLHLARRLARRPVLLTLTYRNDEVDPRLAHLLASLDRERLAVEAPLTRLTGGEVGAMLRAIFALDRPAPAALLEPIYDLTDGNPFFTEEVVQSLVAAGDLSLTDGAWPRAPAGELRIPRSVQAAVRQRALRLTPATQETLALAAVAGRRFDLDLLRELTRRDEAALLAAMKEAVGVQIVVEEAAGRFAFRHALTRQAIYADLLATERAALHRRIAETIERLYAEALETRAADLAYHFFAAGAWAPALTYARQAGDYALAMHAPRAAIEHYTRAVEAADRLGVAPPSGLFRSRAIAYDQTGDFGRARLDYESALRAAREAGDRRAEWQALLDLGFLWTGRDYAQAGDFFQRARSLAHTLDDPALVAHSLNRVGNWLMNAELSTDASQHHRQALTIFERLDDRRGIAATLDLLGMAAANADGDMVSAMAYYERAIPLFQQLDDRPGESAARTMHAVLSGGFYLGETLVQPTAAARDARREAALGLQIARAIGWRAGEAFALFELSLMWGFLGDYGAALPAARQGLALADEIEHRQWVVGAHAALGGIYLDLLAPRLALPHLEQALTMARELGSWLWTWAVTPVLATAHLAHGEPTQTEAVLAATCREQTPSRTAHQRQCWRARADLALARGRPDEALQIVDRLLATALHIEQCGEHGIPRLAKLRGDALAALRRHDEAERSFLAARDGATAQGARPLLWRVEAALGKLYQAQRRHADAEQSVAAARAIIEALAANVPDPELRQTFQQNALALLPRSRPPTPLRAAKEAYGGLTAREREVAALIARGKTNREIAEALSVGEVTVATHVGHILDKLDLTSRTQIAAWALERGLGRAD